MAFHGCSFSFDGIPCEEYGLMVYDFSSYAQGDIPLPSAGEPVTERLERKYRSFLYGLKQNAPLEFSFVFGLQEPSIDAHDPLDRWDIEVIASWLTGHDTYRWLEIEQPDMETFRYRCVISELRIVTSGMESWAFSCKASCDSSFAYLHPQTVSYQARGGPQTVSLFNRSTYNGYYYPLTEMRFSGGDFCRITNHSDGGRVFSLEGLPKGAPLTVWVDHDNQVITNSLGINLYSHCNLQFFRLRRGDNELVLEGDCEIVISCEFPVNVGG